MRYGFSFPLNGNNDNGSDTDKKCALHPEYQKDMRCDVTLAIILVSFDGIFMREEQHILISSVLRKARWMEH